VSELDREQKALREAGLLLSLVIPSAVQTETTLAESREVWLERREKVLGEIDKLKKR